MRLSTKITSLTLLVLPNLHHVSAAPTQSLQPKRLLTRAEPKVYMALGDSYASGIAAGDYVNQDKTSDDWRCSRFTNAYPRLLNGMLPDNQGRTLGHFACSGATCEDVTNNQHFTTDNEVDLITLTAGGNNVGFSNIIDRCVYGFSDIVPWAATYYPKFWNAATDQCDSATFNVWEPQNTDDFKMTKDLRTRMNNLSDKMNAVILSVVQNWNSNNENRVHYVDIDSYFEGHRFCEDEYNEPWPYINNEPNGRPDQWIYQLGTPLGSLQNTDTSAAVGTDELVYAQRFQEALKSGNGTLISAYAPLGDLIDPNADFTTSGGLPLALSKLFHPTSNGQQAIANAISDSIDQLIRDDPTPGDILKGPTTFKQGLGPGGAENDLNIPSGCFVTVPVDNTIPTPMEIADPSQTCTAS
ncbi:SGNH hydrolase-type esterase domain-containing protein [Lophiotrema nucula]|uniref:SGNH hydrolase-type esterase domain-containing protein n=1 Tax=Lophiotrema nucula TaxID=690887 RepID=A0A6A5YVH5_9PLEO|nr:SGNH hydrolase-type esterase domain-containing protein [Lophiotrema nucula]